MRRVLSDLSGFRSDRVLTGFYNFARPLVDLVVDEYNRGNLTPEEVAHIETLTLGIKSALATASSQEVVRSRAKAMEASVVDVPDFEIGPPKPEAPPVATPQPEGPPSQGGTGDAAPRDADA